MITDDHDVADNNHDHDVADDHIDHGVAHPPLPRSPGSWPLLTVKTAPLSAVLPPT